MADDTRCLTSPEALPGRAVGLGEGEVVVWMYCTGGSLVSTGPVGQGTGKLWCGGPPRDCVEQDEWAQGSQATFGIIGVRSHPWGNGRGAERATGGHRQRGARGGLHGEQGPRGPLDLPAAASPGPVALWRAGQRDACRGQGGRRCRAWPHHSLRAGRCEGGARGGMSKWASGKREQRAEAPGKAEWVEWP